jgi:hypothetical protein
MNNTNPFNIYRVVSLPINKCVFIVSGWCLYSNMCVVSCPYNARKMGKVIKPCFNAVPQFVILSYLTPFPFDTYSLKYIGLLVGDSTVCFPFA